MIYAGIMAAGLGVRMHRQDMPKQFLPLGEKPIIIHSLEQFFINAGIGRVVIVVPNEWGPYTEDLLARHNLTNKEFAIIPGGENKTESIGMAVRYIDKTWGTAQDDILIAHDAIRPFITQRIIDDNIAVTKEYGAANTAMRTNDATLVSRNGIMLDEVPPHEHLFAEQTPQSYSLLKFKELLQRADTSGFSLRDEIELPRLWLKMGYEMRLVRGEYFNMKIINPYDLEVANALLRERQA